MEVLRRKQALSSAEYDLSEFTTRASTCIQKATSAERSGDIAQAISLVDLEMEEQLAMLKRLEHRGVGANMHLSKCHHDCSYDENIPHPCRSIHLY